MSRSDLAALLEELYSLQRSGIHPGLETEKQLLRQMGNPADGLRCIHVAGSNGKGSVCAMLEAVLRTAGLRTGLYTSPHLVNFNERIRVNGRPISDADLRRRLPALLTAGRRLLDNGGPRATFFELTTALAFDHFARAGVDIVVLETGMGGRLDATNVVTPLAAVITGISLEHTEYLGNTTAAIAAEKCGIIKPGRPVIVGDLPPDAMNVAIAAARACRAPLTVAAEAVRVSRLRQDFSGQRIKMETTGGRRLTTRLPLLGRHQLQNAALALCALDVIAGETLPDQAVKTGLAKTQWPARLQVLDQNPPIILDGAHNPAGAAAVAAALAELLPRHTPLGLVTAICSDKDLNGFMAAWGSDLRNCWVVPLNNPRALPSEAVAQAARAAGRQTVIAPSLDAGLKAAREWAAAHNGAVCIAGSLFLAGEVLKLEMITG